MNKLIVIAGLTVFTRCGDDTFRPVTATGSDWIIAYSVGTPTKMLVDAQGQHYFDFPAAPGHIDYVLKSAKGVRAGQTITTTFSLRGTGRVVPGANSGNPPAKVRLFLEQCGDTLTAKEETKRWWSTAYVDLSKNGDYSLSTRISPELWTDVFGSSGTSKLAGWQAAIADLCNIGFTFGATFAGHGDIAAGGPERFMLKQYLSQ